MGQSQSRTGKSNRTVSVIDTAEKGKNRLAERERETLRDGLRIVNSVDEKWLREKVAAFR